MSPKQLLAAITAAQQPGSQLQAAIEDTIAGKRIQAKFKAGNDTWSTRSDAFPNFDSCETIEYRPVPEPKHIWVNQYFPNGSVFLHDTAEKAAQWRKLNKASEDVTTEYVEVIK